MDRVTLKRLLLFFFQQCQVKGTRKANPKPGWGAFWMMGEGEIAKTK